MNDRELMEIRADTLFTYDARGRMLQSNEPREQDRRPAPRLFLGRTRDGHVVRVGSTVPDSLTRRLAEIIAREPLADDLHTLPAAVEALRDALARYAPVTEESGPTYRFPSEIAPPGAVIRLTNANRALLRMTFSWLYGTVEDWQPCFAVVHDGAAVSVCFSSRAAARAAEAGVETLPDFRGRGYASAVTAAWGAAVREQGRVPLYSTGWENFASQGVARRVGLIPFGVSMSWR